MKEKRYNQKWACVLAGIDPRVYRRVSKRPADTELRDRLKELSSKRRRFGYRRLHILLKREGWKVNWIEARKADDPGDRLWGGALYRIYPKKG